MKFFKRSILPGKVRSWRSTKSSHAFHLPPNYQGLQGHAFAAESKVRITKSITSTTLWVRESLVYHLAPSSSHDRDDRGWVVKVEKGNKHSNHMMMLHPHSATPFHIQQMPKPVGFQKVLNSLDFHAFELAKAYRVYSDVKSGSESPMLGYRMVISPLTAVLMIIAMGELYHCKLNNLDDDHIVKCNPVGWFPAYDDDVIFYKEKFYVVGEETVVYDSSLIPITVTIKLPQVFKLSKTVNHEEQWVEMESLDDRILFVRIDSRFSVSAKDFLDAKGIAFIFILNFVVFYTAPNFAPISWIPRALLVLPSVLLCELA
ncbi:hypothetical protein M0R45_037470 [Rubus argutus]|uniref:Uncharacterized protein n=1 Tax=Rubus argutus TaxID=59490 RepID=A0AAW1W4K1_RUBAR